MGGIRLVLLFALLSMAAVQDVRSGRISNRLIAAGLMIGIAVQILEYQMWGVYYFLRNISVPVILFYLLFQMRVLGAGDIKLFSMIGSILTTEELFRCMAYSFAAAGAGAAFFVLAGKNPGLKMRFSGGYMLDIIKTGKIESYRPPYEKESVLFAFSVPVLFGTAVALRLVRC